MKIQAVNIFYTQKSISDNITGKEKNTVPQTPKCENASAVKIPISSYIAYIPNFTSKTPRLFSSENIELQEKTSDFIPARLNDIPCPACGKDMINLNKYIEISGELASVDKTEYLEVLKKYKKYMRPVEESVFNEIYELSKKNGASKDIRTLVVSLRDTKLPILQSAQMRQVKKMTALSKTLPPDERTVLQGKIKKLRHHIRKTNAEAPFRRKILIDRISKIKIRNPQQYKKLQNIAKNFPTSYDIHSEWIVKYSGKHGQNEDWTSLEIAQRFLASSVASTDHILAYSIENNHDDISNYIAMHNACNSRKGDKTFLQWIHEDKKNRINFLNNYFKKVDNLLESEINERKYKSYVQLVKDTILKTTNGKINLK